MVPCKLSAGCHKGFKQCPMVGIGAVEQFGMPLNAPDESFVRHIYTLDDPIRCGGHDRKSAAKTFDPLVMAAVDADCRLSPEIEQRSPGYYADLMPDASWNG